MEDRNSIAPCTSQQIILSGIISPWQPKGNSKNAYTYCVSYYREYSFNITKFTEIKLLNPVYLLEEPKLFDIYSHCSTQYRHKLMKMQSAFHSPTHSYTESHMLSYRYTLSTKTLILIGLVVRGRDDNTGWTGYMYRGTC